jgi:uncharacterized protein with HEPN domain
MFDRELVIIDLRNILWAMEQISKRFASINSPSEFTADDAGLEKLDSVCMQLINIGEALKQVDKITSGKLLANYPEIDWIKVKGLRDIITHHYFDIDAETIFVVCREHISPLKQVVSRIIAHLEETA